MYIRFAVRRFAFFFRLSRLFDQLKWQSSTHLEFNGFLGLVNFAGGVMPVPPSPSELLREQLDSVNGCDDVGFVQRKPGRGDTTLSMSCFDKITRWSVVGIQGALLSHILEPLYLSTITIGQSPTGASDGFSVENNIKKVLDARLSSLSSKLLLPFKLNKPLFYEAPIPPKEFQQTSGDLQPLTCG